MEDTFTSFPPAVSEGCGCFTHVFDHELVQILDGLFLEDPLDSRQEHGYGPNRHQDAFKPFAHRVVDKVHGGADVVVHASEGHEEVAVLEAFQDAGREDVEGTLRGSEELPAWS